MTRGLPRLLLGAALAALAIAALRLPAPRVRRPGELLDASAPRRWFQRDTLAAGEALASLLTERGLDPADAVAILDATPLDPRRIPAGLTLEISGDSTGSPASTVRFFIGLDRVIIVRRSEEGWVAEDSRLSWAADTLVIHGTIRSSLYAALDAGADGLLTESARRELAWGVADIFEYRIDMSRELRDGDRVGILVERFRLETGSTRIGEILAAVLDRGDTAFRAVALRGGDGRHRYFDQHGRSLAAAFLKTPVAFRRISSSFGGRRHPVLGGRRQHKGTDFAAASGTPVRTVGDGVVTFAGRRGGYGNLVEVRHPNGYVTRYAHLRGFAGGVRSGATVRLGQTIAFVGSTGLSTGPHLHFELLVGGRQQDPQRALAGAVGTTLGGADRAAFDRVREVTSAALEQPAGVVHLPPP